MTAEVANSVASTPAPSSKRQLGAFYTPDDVALVLVRWALEDGVGPVLDPSFGGCAFLKAGVRVLAERGVGPDAVVGVDIDPRCREFSDSLIPPRNARIADFLSTVPTELPFQQYSAIVGNPPFVRHHWLKGTARTQARKAVEAVGLTARASTWAYFVLHSLQFLAEDGRLALLVPEAILQADYAQVVRDRLQQRFARTRLIHLRSRLFAGTDEAVVLIAAEGTGPGVVEATSVEGAAELEVALSHASISSMGARGLSPAAETILSRALTSTLVNSIASLARVRIGTVTGANNFFVVAQAEANARDLPEAAQQPIVGRTRFLSGLAYTTSDHLRHTLEGKRTLLVAAEGFEAHPAVLAWAAAGEGQGLHERHKCSVRETWFVVRPVPPPDLFGTCSREGGPLLVINDAGAVCTNALHCVYLSATPTPDVRAVAAGFLSSLTALVAERDGRRYGGGLLKLEPGTFARLPVVIARRTDLDVVERLLRDGKEVEARRLVDRDVLGEQLGFDRREVEVFQDAVASLAAERVPR